MENFSQPPYIRKDSFNDKKTMLISARIQALIELITLFIDNTDQPADRMIGEYFKTRRYIGSKDRQFISEHFYTILRQYIYLTAGVEKPTARLIVSRYIDNDNLFDDSDYGPKSLSTYERASLTKARKHHVTEAENLGTSEWLFEKVKISFPEKYAFEINALNESAKTDLRINPIKTTRDHALRALAQDGIQAEATPFSPYGIRLQQRYNLKNHPLFLKGDLEVQDEGAQILSMICDVKSSQRVLDYCAGAGGKSLLLGALMQNTGQLIATDIHDWRLEKAKQRFKRAGLHNTETRVIEAQWLKRQVDRFDRVLIDVPCSGSGTWRRNPDVRLKMTESGLEELVMLQRDIMKKTAPLVKIGGRLIYGTCSILRDENHDQITWFLEQHPEFQLLPIPDAIAATLSLPASATSGMLQLTPYQHQLDGFFVSVLERVS